MNDTDEMQKLVDSVMGNLKALLQEMEAQSQQLYNQWNERSKELQNNRGWQMYEPTEQEEWQRERKQRECDELYDKAKTVCECMNMVARKINRIIGENIVIQFSKWNM
jgi:hypothetical protein